MKNLNNICIAIFLPLIFVGLLNFIIDPFAYFRKNSFYKRDYNFNDTFFLSYGLMAHYPFNSIILGSSVSANFNLEHSAKILGLQNPIKLTMPGASLCELFPYLKLGINKQEVSTILLDLSLGNCNNSGRIPPFLFNDKPKLVNAVKYLFNPKVSSKSLYYLGGKIFVKLFFAFRDYEWMYNWFRPNVYNLDSVKNAYLEYLNSIHKPINYTLLEKQHKKDIEQTTKDHLTHLIPLIKQNPNIHFILWLAPYPLLRYKSDVLVTKNLQEINNQKDLTSLMNIKLLQYSNVEIHDLRTLNFTTDLNRYTDLTHFDQHAQHEILLAIKSQKYRLDKTNLTKFNQKLIKMIEDYQIPKEIQN